MLEAFKTRWEISRNWQLIFPIMGLLGLAYSAWKISSSLFSESSSLLIIAVASGIGAVLLALTLYIFKKLENKWIVDSRWEIIRIFIVFAITGSSSMLIGRPIIQWLGVTKENLNPILYWVLFLIIGLVFYQFLLVAFGWLFGQFEFFWEFEKKMLKRFGLGRFLKE